MGGELVAAETNRQAGASDGKLFVIVLAAGILTLSLQVARVFFPMVFDLGERSGTASSAIQAGALAVLVFVTPVLAPAFRRLLGARRAVVAGIAGLVGLRLAIQVVHPIPLWLSTAAMVAALFSLTLFLHATRTGVGEVDGQLFCMGTLAGLAVDTTLRAAYWSWDFAWQSGSGPFLLSVLVCGVVILELALHARGLPDRAGSAEGESQAALIVGPFLFLHVLFLQNIAFVSSSGRVSLPVAAGVILLGDALGLAAAVWVRGRDLSAAVRLGGALLLIVLAFLLRQVVGTTLIFVVLVAHVLVAGFFALALARPLGETRTTWRASIAFAGGMVVFMLFLVLYQIGYRVALPFPNTVLAPAAAALLVFGGRGAIDVPERIPLSWRSLALIPLVLLLVPAVMALAEEDPIATNGDGRTFRLVSYNAHLGINADGQIDLAELARVIAETRPDVVALQEVVRGWPGAGGLDLAQWLSHRLRMRYTYAPAADDQFGNVILSVLPIREAQGVLLPKPTSGMRRSFLRNVIDIGSGHTVTVVDAHLEGGEVALRAQVEALLRALKGSSDTVIAGDLNMQPVNSNRPNFAAAGFSSAQDLAGQSSQSTAAKPKFAGDRVDWILGTEDVSFSSFRIGAHTTSDHRPLSVIVRVG